MQFQNIPNLQNQKLQLETRSLFHFDERHFIIQPRLPLHHNFSISASKNFVLKVFPMILVHSAHQANIQETGPNPLTIAIFKNPQVFEFQGNPFLLPDWCLCQMAAFHLPPDLFFLWSSYQYLTSGGKTGNTEHINPNEAISTAIQPHF